MHVPSASKPRVPYWVEDGTIQVGALDAAKPSADTTKAIRERLKKDSRHVESKRTTSILIPVASTERCDDLVALAEDLVSQGHSGRIVLARIRTGARGELAEQEATAQMIALADSMAARVEKHIKVDWLVRPATTRARGILDAASDENCTMILMHTLCPAEESDQDANQIGAVAKQVISGSQVPVLIYRAGRNQVDASEATRVVVATDLGPGSPRVVDIGYRLAGGAQIPLMVRNVVRPGGSVTQFSAQQDLKALLRDEDPKRPIKVMTSVVKAPSADLGISHEATSTDLTIVGIRPQSATTSTGHQTTATLVSRLRGPVLVVSVPDRQLGWRGFFQRRSRSLRPKMTSSEAAELRWQIRLDATSSVDFIWMSVLSAAVAVFGLLTDSIPVLIGAMLVAPLMGPMIATGASLVAGDVQTLRRGTLTTLQGIVLVSITAYILMALIGPTTPTQEMINRGSPSLLDCGIGVIGGIVGAYSLARPGVATASAGVAIAAALVPPLCVSAMTFHQFPNLSLGAFILFAANVLAIIAASGLTLLYLGMEPERDTLPKWLRGGNAMSNAWVVIPLFALAVMAVTTFSLASRGTNLSSIATEVDGLMPHHAVMIEPSGSAQNPSLIVRILGEAPPSEAELDLVSEIVTTRTNLAAQFIYEPVLRSIAPSTAPSSEAS